MSSLLSLFKMVGGYTYPKKSPSPTRKKKKGKKGKGAKTPKRRKYKKRKKRKKRKKKKTSSIPKKGGFRNRRTRKMRLFSL